MKRPNTPVFAVIRLDHSFTDLSQSAGATPQAAVVVTVKEIVTTKEAAATPNEMRAAKCLDVTIQAVAQYLMSKGERGEMIEGKDLGIVQNIAAQKIREFESDSN